MNNPDTKSYDVVILGGGLAGLTCALQCRQQTPQASVAVIEKAAHPVTEATHKIGESSVEVGAHYFYKMLDLEDHLENEQIPKMGLRLFFDRGDNSRIEDRLELGGTSFPPSPSYQFDRGRFENYLGERCIEKGVDFIHSATVKDVEINKGNSPHHITYIKDDEKHSVEGRWVVDATGRAAMLKRKMDLKKECDHKASSAWIRINSRVKVDDWSDNEEWGADHGEENPRWFSTNHLLGEGYWIWIIPLASGSTSIGIVSDESIHPINEYNSEEKFLNWIDKYQPILGKELREKRELIQDFSARKKYSTECVDVFSRHRWGIVGDAGYFIDPFYSPGNDFIALANTYLNDLINRDLNGKSNFFQAGIYNNLFRTFFNNTSHIFKENYMLFGNHQVMPVKILWDWLVYWSITGHIFNHGRLTQPMLFVKYKKHLDRLNVLNIDMQKHLRRWHKEKKSWETGGLINTSVIKVIMDSNMGLLDELSDAEFAKRFDENVAKMETIFWEIADHSGIEMETKLKRREYPEFPKGTFSDIFKITSAMPEENAPMDDEKELVPA